MRVLIVGESWVTQSTHIKGVDHFTLSSYVEGVDPLRDALEGAGHTVSHLPAHLVPGQFPRDAEALAAYDVVVLSDIGANSIQLAPAVVERSERHPDRLSGLADWTRSGGGLLMIGGYLSFSGFEAKAAFAGTPVEEVLPVTCLRHDDRVEAPAGATPVVTSPEHEALGGAGEAWPHLLGWNRVTLRDDAQLLATIEGDPLVALGTAGEGRSAVFTSDCAPHWAPPAFSDEWDGYGRLFHGLVTWLAGG